MEKITNKNTTTLNINFKRSEKSTQNKKEYEYYGEIEFLRQSLKLSKNKIGWCDSFSQYFINKDGSGRITTAWGSKNYPKNTFDNAIKKANEIYSKTHNNIFAEEEIDNLIKIIEETIKK